MCNNMPESTDIDSASHRTVQLEPVINMATPVTPRWSPQQTQTALSEVLAQFRKCINTLEETLDILPLKDKLTADIQSITDRFTERLEASQTDVSGLATPTSYSRAEKFLSDINAACILFGIVKQWPKTPPGQISTIEFVERRMIPVAHQVKRKRWAED